MTGPAIRTGDRGTQDVPSTGIPSAGIPSAGAVVGSEFAQVRVDVDDSGNSPRLRLEDLRTGRTRYLDALELETIIWLSGGHLTQLLDPSADRWRDA